VCMSSGLLCCGRAFLATRQYQLGLFEFVVSALLGSGFADALFINGVPSLFNLLRGGGLCEGDVGTFLVSLRYMSTFMQASPEQ